jgi:hypothetical protein
MLDRFRSTPLAPLALIALCSFSAACSSSSSPATSAPDAGDAGDDGAAPPCTAEVNKGPWVVATDGTSAKLRWESCVTAAGTVTLTPEPGGAAIKVTAKVQTVTTTDAPGAPFSDAQDVPGTWYENEVAFTGLAEATCYAYVVDRDATAKGRFCTSRKSGDAFTFAAVGDTDPGLDDHFRKVEEAVYGGAYPIDFTLHMGDIQYYSSGFEPYQAWFPMMAPLLRRGAMIPAMGNHEHEEPHEMTEMVLRFWGGAGFDGTDLTFDFQSGGIWFFSIDTELDFSATSEQMKWLVGRLDAVSKLPGYRFSVVYQHRPMWTCGDSDDHPDEQAYLAPFFKQYKVPLVMWGHMHGYERFVSDGTTYVTTAGGGGTIGDVNKTAATKAYCNGAGNLRLASGPTFHAMVYDVSAAGVHGRAIDLNGAVKDDFTIAAP